MGGACLSHAAENSSRESSGSAALQRRVNETMRNRPLGPRYMPVSTMPSVRRGVRNEVPQRLKSVCENSIFTQPLVRPQIGKHNTLRKFLVLTHPLKPSDRSEDRRGG